MTNEKKKAAKGGISGTAQTIVANTENSFYGEKVTVTYQEVCFSSSVTV